jgi:hypothetical protein
MFSYPLFLANDTQYSKLSIFPDATASEIRDAKTRIANEHGERSKKLRARLALIHESVPELKSDLERVEALRRENDKASAASSKEALRKLAASEQRAIGVDPEYRAVVDEIDQLERKISEINSIRLEDGKERSKYDLVTPPCALLKLPQRENPVLGQRRIMLVAIRRAVAAYIEEELNLPCFHPTDETRRIFLTDFEPNETLDGSSR